MFKRILDVIGFIYFAIIGFVVSRFIRTEIALLCMKIQENREGCVPAFSSDRKLLYENEYSRITMLPYDRQIMIVYKMDIPETLPNPLILKLRFFEAVMVLGVVLELWEANGGS